MTCQINILIDCHSLFMLLSEIKRLPGKPVIPNTLRRKIGGTCSCFVAYLVDKKSIHILFCGLLCLIFQRLFHGIIGNKIFQKKIISTLKQECLKLRKMDTSLQNLFPFNIFFTFILDAYINIYL